MIIALDRKASECDLMKGTIQLRTPLTGYARGEDQPWVMDNGSFSVFDDAKFMRMADVAIGDSNCKWVALPDVVGDHEKTLDKFWEWKRILESHWINKKMKFAFVVQDGATIESIPWDDIVAVFLGGTDRMKRSRRAFRIMRHARRMGKWVHIGRVNTEKWIEYWYWTADSIDGSGLAKYDHMLEAAQQKIRELSRYPVFHSLEDF